MKTYGTILKKVSLIFATDNGGRESVALSNVGGKDGNYSTKNVILQQKIEATVQFKKNVIFEIPTKTEDEDLELKEAQPENLEQIEVTSVQSSHEYLKEKYNARDSSIDTPEKITEYARKKGILFVIK